MIDEDKFVMDFFIKNKERRGSIKVNVRLSGIIAASTGYREREFELPEGTRVKELLDMMELSVKSSWIVTIVNGITVDKTTLLKDNDNVLILPVGGGG